tara:strand:- start:9026 stop:12037 length:3012 start_codon:yes stop_codon:yes gene_type:complete
MAKFVESYCDIAGMSSRDTEHDRERPCFYAHDGAICSILRVHGVRTHMSTDEGVDAMVEAFENIGSNLRDKGHSLTITFEQSENTETDIEKLTAELEEAADRKGLTNASLIDEVRGILQDDMVAERVLIAIWTHRDVALPSHLRAEAIERRDAFGRIPLKGVQNPMGPYQALEAAHWGFVSGVENEMELQGFVTERLGSRGDGREDLAEVRRSILFHETPENWSPIGPGDMRYPPAKETKSADISHLFAPTIDRQLLTSAVTASSDLRQVSVGGRTYALAYLSLFPKGMVEFRRLLDSIRGTGVRARTRPFRIAFHIDGGAKVPPFEQIFSTILSVFGTNNKNKRIGLEGLANEMERGEQVFVHARIMAATWIEPHESHEQLSNRRSHLIRQLNSWQAPSVIDTASDPFRLLVETAPGMTAVARIGKPVIAPIRELAVSLPFHTDAAPERDGETIFMTTDGKPMPFRAHSPEQTSWLNLIWAPPGSGKSVLMNSMNLDFAMNYPSAELPYIGAIDIGASSSGVIKTLQAYLPPERRDLVAFVSMRNEETQKQYRVNPFDIGLGRRMPLKREAAFAVNFLKAMIGLRDDPTVQSLVETVVTRLYTTYSDLSVSGAEKHWQPDRDEEIDAKAEVEGITLHQDLSWWQVADEFAFRGDFRMAERAQRYAMPTMQDVVRLLSTPELNQRYDSDLCMKVRSQVESAIQNFPCFSHETQLDIGNARIVSIDLNAVIYRTPNSDADRRNNLLFFLMARELFVKKISGDVDELPGMKLPYTSISGQKLADVYSRYWMRRYANIQQTRKRFCFDEFHITGSSPIMASQIDQDIRQGRKWGFEIFLASQRISDFDKYVDLASNVFVLKSDTAQDRKAMQDVLGVSDSVVEAVAKHVRGAVPGRVPIFLIGRKMTGGESWHLARNRVGPVRLWALESTMENVAVRTQLFAMLGTETALKILAERFPRGVREYWKQVAADAPEHTDIARYIAESLLSEHLADRRVSAHPHLTAAQ